MNEFNENVRSYQEVVAAERSFFRKVYLWMTLGLVITAISAMYVVASPGLLFRLVTNNFLFWGLIIAEFILVWYLSAKVQSLSVTQLAVGLIIYGLVNGITLSIIFLAYTATSIASTFLITAGTFGAMSIWGYTTKRDLTGVGSFAMMGLFGIIIASIVNIFFRSDMMSFVIAIIGVVVFVGLTAWDTQKLKKIAMMQFTHEESQKWAMMGALILYLDFINLFIYLLRILGNRRR